jgi:hypothetical protein
VSPYYENVVYRIVFDVLGSRNGFAGVVLPYFRDDGWNYEHRRMGLYPRAAGCHV